MHTCSGHPAPPPAQLEHKDICATLVEQQPGPLEELFDKLLQIVTAGLPPADAVPSADPGPKWCDGP